jgi:hypothetical protein
VRLTSWSALRVDDSRLYITGLNDETPTIVAIDSLEVPFATGPDGVHELVGEPGHDPRVARLVSEWRVASGVSRYEYLNLKG